MKNILLVVDIQNGFIVNEMTKNTLHNVEELLQASLFDAVVSTKYVNYPGSPIIKLMGWDLLLTEKEQALAGSVASYTDRIITKTRYSSVNDSLIETLKELNNGELPGYLFVLGVDTECCVLSTAIDLFEIGIRPIILSAYCGSSGGESYHHAGILSLHHLIGKNNIYDGKVCSSTDIEDIVNKIHVF